MLLGLASLVCGLLSFLLVLPGIFSLVLGLVVRVMAYYDLEKMQTGLMDPTGRVKTEEAQAYAVGGMLFGMGGLAVCGCGCWIVWLFLNPA
jgi:hypothetical protein